MTKTPGRGRIYDSITQTIGDTPLVRLNRMAKEAGAVADVLLKLEFFNPMASVKDRIGVSMIEDLEARGVLKPGTTLIERTARTDPHRQNRGQRHDQYGGDERDTALPFHPGTSTSRLISPRSLSSSVISMARGR